MAKLKDLSPDMTDAELMQGLAAYAHGLFTGLAAAKTFSPAYRAKCRALAARFETLSNGSAPKRRAKKVA